MFLFVKFTYIGYMFSYRDIQIIKFIKMKQMDLQKSFLSFENYLAL